MGSGAFGLVWPIAIILIISHIIYLGGIIIILCSFEKSNQNNGQVRVLVSDLNLKIVVEYHIIWFS
jgi:hypothetical protein